MTPKKTSSGSRKTAELRIDKALFEAGSQCAKRFHLEVHRLRPKPAPSEVMTEIGRRVVELARKEFRGGIPIEGLEPEEAIAKTRETIEAGKPVILFDARFESEQTVAQVDIVFVIGPGKIDLFEIKAGTTVKRRHLFDVALQIYTVEKSGFEVRGATVLHLDPRYRHVGGTKVYATEKLFKSVDVTARSRRLLPGVEGRVRRLLDNVDNDEALALPTGTWCRLPLPCPFFASCMDEGPDQPIVLLPELSREQEASMHEAGLEDLANVSAEHGSLTETQRRAVVSIQQGTPIVEPFVGEELRDLEYPALVLDVRWHVEVLPTFEGQRPWQQLPIAWSLHGIDESGTVEHRSFVADAGGDPRSALLESLAEATEEAGMLITYQPEFEKRLRSVMDDSELSKQAVRSILNRTWLDLARLVERGVYAPEFRGGFDFRIVHDTLCEEPMPKPMSKGALEEAFRKLLSTRTRANTRKRLADAITEQSEARTAAMLELIRTLQGEPAAE